MTDQYEYIITFMYKSVFFSLMMWGLESYLQHLQQLDYDQVIIYNMSCKMIKKTVINLESAINDCTNSSHNVDPKITFWWALVSLLFIMLALQNYFSR